MALLRVPRLPHWLAAMSFGVVSWSVSAGFGKESPQAVVGFGSLSCLFWLTASTLPIYWTKLRQSPDTIDGLNSFAAASTGAAVIASVPNAWTVLFNLAP